MAIIKHNKLIETSYKLNSREQFFVIYLISQISQHDNSFQEYKMHYSEIEKIINFDGKRRIANKGEVFALMDKLNSEPILYERGSVIGKSVWLQHMEHDTETDIFTFSLSSKLREYLIQLKEHFTRYNISNIVYLNANAVRLYEVLKRHQFKGECEITVDKIKFYLGIENKYPKYYEFKRWVLVPSQQEIEKYTDIRFDFIPAKKERKRILSLKFSIFENEPKYTPDTMKLLSKIDDQISKKLATLKSPSTDKWTSDLSASQLSAYQFLVDKGVNCAFVAEQVLAHPKVKYLPLQGYEDVYVRYLWKFFSDKTNVSAEKKAGAFVSWWKKDRLTEDGLHAHMIEKVIQRKRAMDTTELEKRQSQEGSHAAPKAKIAGEMYDHIFKSSDSFDYERFKRTYPEQDQKIVRLD